MTRIRRLRLAVPIALLSVSSLGAGCATTAPPTQRIDVPVYVPCVKKQVEKPEFEFDKLSVGSGDGQKILALARDWVRGRKYEADLRAALGGCI